MIVDAKDLIVGRLATVVSKKALMGEKIDIVNCEKAIITGKKTEIYSRLKKRGESPVICEGYVVTNRKIIDKNNECVDIIVAGKQRKGLPHTWVRNGNEIIDITKNQFNK